MDDFFYIYNFSQFRLYGLGLELLYVSIYPLNCLIYHYKRNKTECITHKSIKFYHNLSQ